MLSNRLVTDHVFKRILYTDGKVCGQGGCGLIPELHASSLPPKLDMLSHLKIGVEGLMAAMDLDVSDPELSQTPRRAAEWFISFARKPNYDADMENFLSLGVQSFICGSMSSPLTTL